MNELEVRFVKDLPPEERPKNKRRNWREVADALRAEPHEQAVIGIVDRNTITRLRNGDYKDFRPTSDWEWAIKSVEGRPQGTKVWLLGKFIGAPPKRIQGEV